MAAISRYLRRIAALFRRDRLDDQLREEIAGHIELRRRQLIEAGVDPADAQSRARQQFGNATRIREDTREMWSLPALDTIVQDLRYGVRMMRRSPAVALVAIVSLGLGIGGAAAVFGLADALLLRELPVRSPEQLAIFRWTSGPVSVFESLNGNTQRNDNDFSVTSTSFSTPAFEAMRQDLSDRANVFGFAELYRVNLSIDGQADVVSGHVVSGNYYSALGLSPAQGRLIGEADDRADAAPVAVISHAFWQRRFGGANAVGRQLALNGVPFTIVGVAPAGFRGTLQVGQEHDVVLPMASYDSVYRSESASPNYWWVLVMARLTPGARRDQIQPAADLIVKRTTASARPQLTPQDLPRVSVEPGNRGQTESRESVREPLITMALVITILLLVACANVANLMLARGRARVRELTIRVAIGAGRTRVIRQLVTEGLLLAAGGGVLGLLLARFIAAALLPALTGSASILDDGELYWRVGLFTTGAAIGCTLLFGVLPAIRATDVRLASGLQEASRSNDHGATSPPAGGHAGGRPGGALDAPGDRRRAARGVAPLAGANRSRLRPGERAGVQARSSSERLRRSARARADGECARAAAPDTRRSRRLVLEPRADFWRGRCHGCTASRHRGAASGQCGFTAVHLRAPCLEAGHRRAVPDHDGDSPAVGPAARRVGHRGRRSSR